MQASPNVHADGAEARGQSRQGERSPASVPSIDRRPLRLYFEEADPSANTTPAPGGPTWGNPPRAPARPEVAIAERATRRAAPIREEGHRVTHEALAMNGAPAREGGAAPRESAASNASDAGAQPEHEQAGSRPDRAALEQALCEVLRDAARRHGLDV
jgi:hypothetical protein